MTSSAITLVFIDLATIVMLARGLGHLAQRLHQPAVTGELIAGIVVLPLLVHIGIARDLYPADVRSFLTALANLGVALFMFAVGMEFDLRLLGNRRRTVAAIALSATALPLALGLGLGWFLLRGHPHPRRIAFILFVGIVCAVTAFPVLARILFDRGMRNTPIGTMALSCAAIGDIGAWLLLALAVALADAGGHPRRLLLLVPYLCVFGWVIRPLLTRVLPADGTVRAGNMVLVLAGAMLSGAATEWMGLHFIFGAFLFGAAVPGRGASKLGDHFQERFAEFNHVLLLPVFFLITGLSIDFSRFDLSNLTDFLLILLVAMAGKVGGTFVAARLAGLGLQAAVTLGVLMNCRGLTELIVLSVGAQLGLLDRSLYTAFVSMAVFTTILTGVLLRWVYPARQVAIDTAQSAMLLRHHPAPPPPTQRLSG